MSKPNFQSTTISLVKKAAPYLKYVARYNATEDCVSSCMSGYENRSFVYLLTSTLDEKEYYIYVGKTTSQYTRFLSQIKKIDFSYIYLFECEEKNLAQSERLIIKELKPLYNRKDNPLAMRYSQIICIDYTKPHSSENIKNDLQLKLEYESSGLFGFTLNPAIFSVLKLKSEENNCNCSEMLQLILENLYSTEIVEILRNSSEPVKTNLTTTNKYAEKHNRSRESIKQFLKEENRIRGAMRIGRDWVFPDDALFPADRRKK